MRRMFKATLITLVPDAFPGPLGVSILGRAEEKGLWAHETVDLRSFGVGKHRNVDDTPAGGGAGMVLRPDVAAGRWRGGRWFPSRPAASRLTRQKRMNGQAGLALCFSVAGSRGLMSA